MSKKKRIIIIISIITFAMLLVGGTFAWLIFDGALVFGNSQAQSSCFVIDYDYTNDDGTMDLSGTLMQTSVPKTGLSGKVQLGIHPDCSDTMGEGTIYLNVASADTPLLQPVAKAHCENPLTLQTMKNYTTSSACTSAGYTWVSNKPALKYAVYQDIDSSPVSVGYINKTGSMVLHNGITLFGTAVPYYIYIWLDGELANNSYMGVNLMGTIHIEAEQKESMAGEAYAIYSETDNSLRFYRLLNSVSVGSTYKGRTVSAVYTGFEKQNYTSDNIPWASIRQDVASVVFEDIVRPKSTAYWFENFGNCSYFNVAKLDTSNVLDMTNMFNNAGTNVDLLITEEVGYNTNKVDNGLKMLSNNEKKIPAVYIEDGVEGTFTIVGMENWNTSRVINMAGMFNNVAVNATNFNIGDISKWNVSNVTNMVNMFTGTGSNATNDWSIDVSNWKVDKVTNQNSSEYSDRVTIPRFYNSYAVYSASDQSLRFYRTQTDLTKESTWNGKTITNVYTGFETSNNVPWSGIKENVKIIVFEDTIVPISTVLWFSGFKLASYIDVTKLDVSNVTDMSSMFSSAGYNASKLVISGMEKWKTSNVTSMGYMFAGCGYETSELSILGMDKWDTSSVTNMNGMFMSAGYNAKTINMSDISKWNVFNVIDMSSMFSAMGLMSENDWFLDLNSWKAPKVSTVYVRFSSGDHVSAPIWYTTYAVYSVDDNSLRFYRTQTDLTKETAWNGKKITAVYSGGTGFQNTGFEDTLYSSASSIPWYSYSTNITKVVVEDEIFPTYTAYWFNNLLNSSYFDVNKLNVSSVGNMNSMFASAGKNATTFNINGLNGWNTSKVTNMNSMFSNMGLNSSNNWSIDLSDWNVSKVTSYSGFNTGVGNRITLPNFK